MTFGPGSAEDADGVGVVVSAGSGRLRGRRPGVVVAGVAGEVAPASRSCLSADQRKVTVLTLPDWRVEGATPARQAASRRWGTGRGRRDLGEQPRGAQRSGAGQRLVTMCYSGWTGSCSAICVERTDLGVQGAQDRHERQCGDRVDLGVGGRAPAGERPEAGRAGPRGWCCRCRPTEDSQAPSRVGESQSALAWVVNRSGTPG